LHFMLTGRAPVELASTDVGRDTLARWTPTRSGQENEKIPKALKAICLKGLSQAPANRYSSAAEMSADIVNHLGGRPVSAYRENLVERTGRWAGQNRYVLLLIVAYLVMRLIVFFSLGH